MKPDLLRAILWSPRSFRAALESAGFVIVRLDIIFETEETAVGSYYHECETIRAEIIKPQAPLGMN